MSTVIWFVVAAVLLALCALTYMALLAKSKPPQCKVCGGDVVTDRSGADLCRFCGSPYQEDGYFK